MIILMRLILYVTAILGPALIGSWAGDGFGKSLVNLVPVLLICVWLNMHLYRTRMYGRAVINDPFCLEWGWLAGIAAAFSVAAGFLTRTLPHSEQSLGILYVFLGLAMVCIEKILDEGPAYGWEAQR